LEQKLKTVTREGREGLSLKILVADDDPQVRTLNLMILRSFGHQVEEFDNGKSLLDRLEKGAQDFNLIVSDNSMPGMTGVEVLKKIRLSENKRLKTLPFIIATSDPGDSLVEDIEKLDGVFLAKPFKKEQLSDAVKKAMENRK
jgi:CheY-like chemotaxis protein